MRSITRNILIIVLLNMLVVGYGLVQLAKVTLAGDCEDFTNLNLTKYNNKYLRWTGKSCPLNVCLDSSLGGYGSYVEQALAEWNEAWNTTCSQNKTQCEDGIFKKHDTGNCAASSDPIKIKKVSSTGGDDEFGQCILSVTDGNPYAKINSATIELHQKNFTSPLAWRIRRAAEHELGHALGIAHDKTTSENDRMDTTGGDVKNVEAWDDDGWCNGGDDSAGISNRDAMSMTCTPTFLDMCSTPYRECVLDWDQE